MPKGPDPPRDLPPATYVTVSGGGWWNHASFQLRGQRLEPDDVTRALGIEPSDTAKRGEPRRQNPQRTNRTGAWTLRSDNVLSAADDDLNSHLRWLLDQLEPRGQQLRDVVREQDLDAELWCVVLMESANVDFVLRPETMGRAAAIGATLRLDIYGPKDADRDVIEIPEPDATSGGRRTE